jgi:hypothetical protein
MQSQMRMYSSEYHKDLDTVNNLQKQQASLLAGGMSTDDPQYQAIDAQITQIQKTVQGLQPTMDNLDSFMKQNVNGIITGTHVSGVTGNPAEVVGGQSSSPRIVGNSIGDAPKGTPDGATNTINGRSVIVQGGKVYYTSE